MTDAVEETINQVFTRLSEGNLPTSGPRLESGWEMSLPSGEKIARSTLQAEAQTAIDLAAAAIPHLIPYVRHENLAIRYVAIYALEQITGARSGLPYFGRTMAAAEIEQEVQTWLKWYNRHRPAEQ